MLLRQGPLPGAPRGGDPHGALRQEPRPLRASPAPSEGENGGRGRPRKYGEKAKRPSEWLEKGKGTKKGWRSREVMVRGRAIRLRHRVEGPYLLKGAAEQAVFLIVVKGVDLRAKRRRRRDPSFFLVSGVWEDDEWRLPFSAEKLLFWA